MQNKIFFWRILRLREKSFTNVPSVDCTTIDILLKASPMLETNRKNNTATRLSTDCTIWTRPFVMQDGRISLYNILYSFSNGITHFIFIILIFTHYEIIEGKMHSILACRPGANMVHFIQNGYIENALGRQLGVRIILWRIASSSSTLWSIFCLIIPILAL